MLKALKKAADRRDELIAIVADSADAQEASQQLSQQFGFTDLQALAVLDMQMRRLTARDRTAVADDIVATTARLSQHGG